MKPKIEIYKDYENSQIPTKGSEDAACYDLRANFTNKSITIYNMYGSKIVLSIPGNHIDINPYDIAQIETGLRFRIEKGHYVAIYPRSGAAIKEHKFVANSPGIIDSDYRGKVMVAIFNASDKPIRIEHGDRIAQMELRKSIECELIVVDDFDTGDTARGTGGFGSTGTK